MREVTLRIRHHGEPESDVSAQYPDVTFRSVSSMTGRATKRKRIVELQGPTDQLTGFLSTFRSADAILEAELLSPLDNDRVYIAVVVEAAEWDSIAERLSAMGIHHRTGTTIIAGIETWTLFLADDAELGAVMASLEAGGNDVELVRNVPLATVNRSPQIESSGDLRALTPRQREVLAAAIDAGYYEHGMGVTVADVAATLDLSTTTVWEHLSRAESKIMDGLRTRLDS